MYTGMQFWQDKLPSGLVRKFLPDGRIIETFPDMPSGQYAFLTLSACQAPEHKAVIDDLGRVLTYAQLKEKTDALIENFTETSAEVQNEAAEQTAETVEEAVEDTAEKADEKAAEEPVQEKVKENKPKTAPSGKKPQNNSKKKKKKK